MLIHNKILLVLLLRIILPYRRSLSFALQKVVQTALRVCHTSAFSWCSPARRSDGVHQHRACFSSPSLWCGRKRKFTGTKMDKFEKKNNVFVTVGTTSFDALVEAMDSEEVVQTLIERGYDSLTIQRGRGAYVPKHIVSTNSTTRRSTSFAQKESSSSRSSATPRRTSFKVQVVEFLPSLDGALQEAALVISHAGAGSVFESLSLGKPTLVVVNESLMDNHQVELAETLAASGHVAWTKPGELLQALNAFDPNKLVKYEKGECTLAKDVEEFIFL